MKDFTSVLALPASLLSTLIIPTIDAQALAWPHNLPRTAKYHPEHEPHIKRDAEVQSRLAQQNPIGMRKMSDDLGQKFYLDYWTFGELEGDGSQRRLFSNGSSIDPLLRPIIPHTNRDRQRRDLFGRDVLARDYNCPANTGSCASIGYEDVCCSVGESCVETSQGVGCCPSGQTCGDSISECDGSLGYTQCETGSSGGCCVPGAQCESGGCVFYGTQTVYTTLPTERVTTGVSTTIETSSGREITVVYTTVQSSLYTTTETVTATPSGSITTRTIVVGGGVGSSTTPTTCAAGFYSCPATLGGGCCPTGQACATDDLCPDTTAPAGAPIIPASSSDTPVSAATITSSPATTISTTPEYCPTGFYMCSARYLGGCCRVDRNCDTTSCPPQDSTTVVNAGDATVAAASTAGGGSSCANGWALCPAAEGGGCCPSGYSCGAESCSASGQQDTQKMQPNLGVRVGGVVLGWMVAVVGMVAGVGMVWL